MRYTVASLELASHRRRFALVKGVRLLRQSAKPRQEISLANALRFMK